MPIKMKYAALLIFSLLMVFACKKSGGTGGINTPPVDTTVNTTFFAKGADISWITQMESQGIKF